MCVCVCVCSDVCSIWVCGCWVLGGLGMAVLTVRGPLVQTEIPAGVM